MARLAGILAAACALALLVAVAATAWWSSAPARTPGTISTGAWGDPLSFHLGASRAPHFERPQYCDLEPIAGVDDQGDLSLDFGDLLPRRRARWDDVFRITSSASSPLFVAFTVEGEIAPFVQSVAFVDDTQGGRLDPGVPASVAVTITVPPKTPGGDYSGALSVLVAGRAERHTMPMVVTVLGKKPHPRPSGPPSAFCSPSPGSSPSVSPSCSPSASPDWSPSASPSCSPSTSPSCSPSASPSSGPSPSPGGDPDPAPSGLFDLAPGLSVVLPAPGMQPPLPPVVQVRDDGTLALDFGSLPKGISVNALDVLRITSQAQSTATVGLSITGPVRAVCARVGFREGKYGIRTGALALRPGDTEQIAFSLYAPRRTATGPLQGSLVLTMKDGEGRVGLSVLPITIEVVGVP